MRLYYFLLLFITDHLVFVYSQHELTNKVRSSISGTLSDITDNEINSKSEPCAGFSCRSTGIIIASTVCGFLGILVCCNMIFRCYKQYQYQWPSEKPSWFGRRKTYKPCNETVFQSGLWSARYLQAERWYGPNYYSLLFNSISFKITGSGLDSVGTFDIIGAYAKETGRILLIKKYQLGTGNPSKNFGHRVWIRLVWNENTSQFEGTWNIRTKIFHGKDQFELKYSDEPQPWVIPIGEQRS